MALRQSAQVLRGLSQVSGLTDGLIKLGSFGGVRQLSTNLKDVLEAKIPAEQEKFKAIKKEHGAKVLGEVTVEQALGGMRGIPAMVWETSLLDPEEGIRFRGFSIPELQEKLPVAKENSPFRCPLPEGLLWLLLTGDLPTPDQVKGLSEDLRRRSHLPKFVYTLLDHLPYGTHPMTQLSQAVLSLQVESKFQKAYHNGVHKSKYWCADRGVPHPYCPRCTHAHIHLCEPYCYSAAKGTFHHTYSGVSFPAVQRSGCLHAAAPYCHSMCHVLHRTAPHSTALHCTGCHLHSGKGWLGVPAGGAAMDAVLKDAAVLKT